MLLHGIRDGLNGQDQLTLRWLESLRFLKLLYTSMQSRKPEVSMASHLEIHQGRYEKAIQAKPKVSMASHLETHQRSREGPTSPSHWQGSPELWSDLLPRKGVFSRTQWLTLQPTEKALRGLLLAWARLEASSKESMKRRYNLRWMGLIRIRNTYSCFSGSACWSTVWPRLEK